MKKIILLLVVASVLVGLSSCNSKQHALKKAHKKCNCPTWD